MCLELSLSMQQEQEHHFRMMVSFCCVALSCSTTDLSLFSLRSFRCKNLSNQELCSHLLSFRGCNTLLAEALIRVVRFNPIVTSCVNTTTLLDQTDCA